MGTGLNIFENRRFWSWSQPQDITLAKNNYFQTNNNNNTTDNNNKFTQIYRCIFLLNHQLTKHENSIAKSNWIELNCVCASSLTYVYIYLYCQCSWPLYISSVLIFNYLCDVCVCVRCVYRVLGVRNGCRSAAIIFIYNFFQLFCFYSIFEKHINHSSIYLRTHDAKIFATRDHCAIALCALTHKVKWTCCAHTHIYSQWGRNDVYVWILLCLAFNYCLKRFMMSVCSTCTHRCIHKYT